MCVISCCCVFGENPSDPSRGEGGDLPVYSPQTPSRAPYPRSDQSPEIQSPAPSDRPWSPTGGSHRPSSNLARAGPDPAPPPRGGGGEGGWGQGRLRVVKGGSGWLMGVKGGRRGGQGGRGGGEGG